MQKRGTFSRGGVEDTRLEAKAKDTKKIEAQDRPSRGQGQGPRIQAQVFSKKKKVFKNFFQAFPKKDLQKNFSGKKGLQKFFFKRFPLEENKKGLGKFFARFLALSYKISTVQKIVLSLSREQANF